ncbi:MAG: FAD-dependent monooxygenase, partial [Nitrosopumilaceae archaeon]
MQESVNAESSKIFTDVREVDITRAIADEFHSVLVDRADSDVIIIGAGPAGLTASRELASMGF